MNRLRRRLVQALAAGAATPLVSGCTSAFFHPSRQFAHVPTDAGVAYDDVFIRSGDLRLHGWFLPVPAGMPVRARVVHLHGNAQNIGSHVASVLWLPERGVEVFAFDWRGYGRSEGVPTLDGLLLDARAMLDHALDAPSRDGAPPPPVFVLGQSLGGAIGLVAAGRSPRRHALHGVIADSAFSGFRHIARDVLSRSALTRWARWPAGFAIDDSARPVDEIARIAPTPLLLIHGTGDTVVPARESQTLFDAAQEPKTLWLVPGAPHIGVLRAIEWRAQCIAWMDAAIAARPPG
jgi:hypothetical protein